MENNKKFGFNVLVKFNRNSGKILTTMEGYGTALMRMWVLNNLTKTQDCVIFSKENGEILHYFEGRGKDTLPEEIEALEVTNIEELCPGLLAQLQ
jgi:hypothetical protein